MNKFKTSAVALLLASSVFSAFAASIGDEAPALKIKSWVQGGPAEVKEGQVTVVEFWATWCPPCRTSIPHINDLYNKYKDQGVVVIGLSSEEKSDVSKFVKRMGDKMQYPVGISTAEAQRGYMGAFGARGIPHAFVVGADGKFAWQGHPMDPGFERSLENAIAKKAELGGKTESADEGGAEAPEAKSPDADKPAEPNVGGGE